MGNNNFHIENLKNQLKKQKTGFSFCLLTLYLNEDNMQNIKTWRETRAEQVMMTIESTHIVIWRIIVVCLT